LLALIGGAVGLGNFLRFPFQAAKYGGGAFLVPYLIAVVVLAFPMVWIEMILGRSGEGKVHSITRLLGLWGGPLGRVIGSWGVYVSLVVGSYYALLTGWTLGYTTEALLGMLSHLTPETAQEYWKNFQLQGPYWTLLVLFLMGLTMTFPIQKGLERLSLYGMPLLFILGAGIAIGALFLGKAGPCETCDSRVGIAYLYTPRWEALVNPSVWLAAAGQVFFSVGVGFAMYPVYASYYASSAGIRKAGAQTILANTLAEVGLGGLLSYP
jgi:NSS family neurotransmitter:Na+ symporter